MKFYGVVQSDNRNRWLNFQQTEIQPLLKKLPADFEEIFRKALQWYKERLIENLANLDQHADSPNRESGQYGSNELPLFMFTNWLIIPSVSWLLVAQVCDYLSCQLYLQHTYIYIYICDNMHRPTISFINPVRQKCKVFHKWVFACEDHFNALQLKSGLITLWMWSHVRTLLSAKYTFLSNVSFFHFWVFRDIGMVSLQIFGGCWCRESTTGLPIKEAHCH